MAEATTEVPAPAEKLHQHEAPAHPEKTTTTRKTRAAIGTSYFAILKNADGLIIEVKAKDQKELKEQLSDPDLELLSVFKGRKLHVQQKRAISFGS